MHLCTELTAASWMLELLGEDCVNFSLKLSSRTQFAKIEIKKVIAKNQCEKHKKLSLVLYGHMINKIPIKVINLKFVRPTL